MKTSTLFLSFYLCLITFSCTYTSEKDLVEPNDTSEPITYSNQYLTQIVLLAIQALQLTEQVCH